MILKRTLTAVLIFFAWAARDLDAQVNLDKVAQSTMNFQLVSVSPKASALGEAYYAVGTGSDAIFYNPAGLAEMNGTFDVSLDYTQWIADINYFAGAAAWNLGSYGVVGLSVLSVDYGTINWTTLDLVNGYVDNGPLPNIGAYSVGLSYARFINTQFSVGGNIRFVGQNLGENIFLDGTTVKNGATRLVFDLGVKYNTGFKDFRFSMAYRNFSSEVSYAYQSEQLPATFTLGTAIDLIDFFVVNHDRGTSLTFSADYLHSNNYSERINLGLEYRLLGILALRGGYQTNRDIQSWSGGVGFNSTLAGSDIEVNYSFSKMDFFNNVNRFSVRFSF